MWFRKGFVRNIVFFFNDTYMKKVVGSNKNFDAILIDLSKFLNVFVVIF